MPRGGKPKVYDVALVERVRDLYAEGNTQAEVGAVLGLSQKIVWNLMRRHGLTARVAAKRDQEGDKNSVWGGWKGTPLTYAALHKRVEARRGRARRCDRCGSSDPGRTYDWANLTGNYEDVNDYERMCRQCHRRYDNARRGGDA